MNIHELALKIKSLSHKTDEKVEVLAFDKNGTVLKHSLLDKFYLALIIILISVLSFGLGRLSGGNTRSPVTIEYDESLLEPSTQGASVITTVKDMGTGSPVATGGVVASKNGTKYHYLYCSGAKRITDANKITFEDAKAAEAAGYTLAANCSPR